MTLTIEARPRSPALDAAAVRRLAGTLAGWAARAAARRGRASDFGAVALFGNEQFRTLPFYLYQQIGSYRSQDGAVTALLLLLLCFLLFTVIERLPGRDVKTE